MAALDGVVVGLNATSVRCVQAAAPVMETDVMTV